MKDKEKKTPEELSVEEIASAVCVVRTEDAAEQTPAFGEGRVPLTHRTAAKVAAFLLALLAVLVTVVGAVAAVLMINQQFYITPQESYLEMALTNLAEGDARQVMYYMMSEEKGVEEVTESYLKGKNIASAYVSFTDKQRQDWSYSADVPGGPFSVTLTFEQIHAKDTGETFYYSSLTDYRSWHDPYSGDNLEVVGEMTVKLTLAENLTKTDEYRMAWQLIRLGYALRYWIYAIIAAALVLFVVCFAFLMCAAGRRKSALQPQPGWGTRIPFDLLTAAGFIAVCFLLSPVIEPWSWSNGGDSFFRFLLYPAAVVLCGGGCLAIVLGWCMSFALRIKLGGWWKNTLTWRVLRFAGELLKKLCSGVKRLCRGVWSLMRQIPLVWKTALFLAVLAILELFVLMRYHWNPDILLFWWFVGNLLLIPAGLLTALQLRRLQKGGKALAAGDLSYQVDTRRMFCDFKRHGEDLNRIGEGMTAAVEQRMKSERMKTELITNVSHDIKTPLTSVINYADLIGKEDCDNPRIREYAEVLHRQSERLKRLIDDLVEASKASTGNLEVDLMPCDAATFVNQTAGEYQDRLKECDLTLITEVPEEGIRIMADGRRMYRIFDNLMNNICKYAQSGTRVYLSLERKDNDALFVFRNTSREQLNISEDELMERFTRGDQSRNTEGNGLGLSIAKSMAELQNGSLKIVIDGDLFKANLSFPIID